MTDIPVGYKQTEIGIIPNDWEVSELGNISDYIGGAQPPLSYFSAQKREGYIRLIQIRDYKTYNFIVYIPQELARKTCSADDIMIGRYGPPIFQILRGIEGAYNVALLKAIPNENKLDKEFFYYTLKRHDLFLLIDLLSRRTSGQTGVDLDGLRGFQIALPPLPEQQAIATTLSDMDELISNLDELIEKKKNIKKGAMQKLLSPKEGWIEIKLGDIGSVKRGVSYKPANAHTVEITGTTCLLRSNNIKGGRINYENVIYVDTSCINSEQMMKPGDILVCAANGSRALVGKSGLYKGDGGNITFGAFMSIFRTNDSSVSEFVSHLFHSYKYKKQLDEVLTGSAINNLNGYMIENMTFLVPPTVKEQQVIANILSDMDKEIEALEEKKAKYEQIKQGAMQKLLTGKIRLV